MTILKDITKLDKDKRERDDERFFDLVGLAAPDFSRPRNIRDLINRIKNKENKAR